MEIPEKMSLKEAKVIIQKMLNKEQDILSLAQLMKYSEQSEMIELAMRCVCIDKDIERLKETQHCATEEIAYNINNIHCALETDDEIRTFWSALHPNDLLVLAYINQNDVGYEN
jgi:hypothetical protein